MKKLYWAIGLASVQLIAAPAFAQTSMPGDSQGKASVAAAPPPASAAVPKAHMTRQERAAVHRMNKADELKHRDEMKRANKAGEIPSPSVDPKSY